MKLIELCNLKYNNSYGGIFRLAKGKSPMAIVKVIQHEGVVLVECLYLKSGKINIHLGEKEIVPLKLGVFEDDKDFMSKQELEEIKHLGCRNWPNCDTEGCGEW